MKKRKTNGCINSSHQKCTRRRLSRYFAFALQQILQNIQQDLKDFRVEHDSWFSEKSLLTDPEILTPDRKTSAQ